MPKYERIETRFRENTALLGTYYDHIFDQHSKRVYALKFGDSGNIGANGCGPVAVHNAMKLIGMTVNFCDVIRDFEELKLSRIRGLFGTKPFYLGRYFRKHNIPYEKYNSPAEFKSDLIDHKAGIICTWNKRMKGMHFYCIFYDKSDEKYYTANCYSNCSGFREIKLSDISDRRFVVGYLL